MTHVVLFIHANLAVREGFQQSQERRHIGKLPPASVETSSCVDNGRCTLESRRKSVSIWNSRFGSCPSSNHPIFSRTIILTKSFNWHNYQLLHPPTYTMIRPWRHEAIGQGTDIWLVSNHLLWLGPETQRLVKERPQSWSESTWMASKDCWNLSADGKMTSPYLHPQRFYDIFLLKNEVGLWFSPIPATCHQGYPDMTPTLSTSTASPSGKGILATVYGASMDRANRVLRNPNMALLLMHSQMRQCCNQSQKYSAPWRFLKIRRKDCLGCWKMHRIDFEMANGNRKGSSFISWRSAFCLRIIARYTIYKCGTVVTSALKCFRLIPDSFPMMIWIYRS